MEFGRLTALYPWKQEGVKFLRFWLFICSCGTVKILDKGSVMRGHSQSCGCLASELSSKRAKEYWQTHDQTGENHHNWKGGPKKLNRIVRNSVEMTAWRKDVFTRDSYTCQGCGQKGGYLHAHHVIHLATILYNHGIKDWEDAKACPLLWDRSNGLTLCNDCHQAEHPELNLNRTKQRKELKC